MEEMSVSAKVLRNPSYKVVPVFAHNKTIYSHKRPEDLRGVRLVHAKSGTNVWEKNGGVITMAQLSVEAQEYVKEKFTNRDHLKVFGSIGD